MCARLMCRHKKLRCFRVTSSANILFSAVKNTFCGSSWWDVHLLCHSFGSTFWHQVFAKWCHSHPQKTKHSKQNIRCGLRESINDRVDFCVLVISSNRQTLSICQTVPMSTFIRAMTTSSSKLYVNAMPTPLTLLPWHNSLEKRSS